MTTTYHEKPQHYNFLKQFKVYQEQIYVKLLFDVNVKDYSEEAYEQIDQCTNF